MTKTYQNPITTTHESWHAVHDALQDGLTIPQICETTGLSYGMVHNIRRMKNPARSVYPFNRAGTHKGIKYRCMDCDAPVNRTGEGAENSHRCRLCHFAYSQRRADTASRALLAWANDHGYVPTVTAATQITGMGRSRTGDIIADVFGADTRPRGGARRKSFRGWPHDAPDVPRPDQVELMREQGRNAMASRHATHA